VAYDYRQARDRIFGVTRDNGKIVAFEPGDTTPAERLLLLALVEFAPNIEPSTLALAKMMNVDERQVRRLLRALEQKGRLVVERRGGRRSRYHLTDADPGHHVPDPGHGVPPDETSPRTPRPPTPDVVSSPPRTPRPPKQTSKADKKADKDPEPYRLVVPEPPKKRSKKAKGAEVDPISYRSVVDAYFVGFRGKHGKDPVFGSAEGSAVKRLLVKLNGDPAEACRRVANAFASWRGGSVTIGDIATKPDAFTTLEPPRSGVRQTGPRQPNHGAFDASAYEA
jgi:hypothetical protein